VGNKWIGRLVTLSFLGIPAILFLLSSVYGSVPAAFEHWFSEKDRAEQKELYSIIGDQEVSKVATKYISGSMVCIDSFNDSELPMEFEKVWVRTRISANDVPLRGFVSLYTGRDFYQTDGFSKKVPPDECRIDNEELKLPFEIDAVRNVSAMCRRKATVSQIVRQTIDSGFWVRSEDGDFLEGAYVETRYAVDCETKVTRVLECLPREYGNKLYGSLTHEYDFGAFTEYNYCDNPENAEFKRQVLDRWSRAAQNSD